MRNVIWLFLVLFALVAPVGCGQGDTGALPPTPAENVGSTEQRLTTIDTTGPTNSTVCCMGASLSFGQTFTVPAVDVVLNSFSVVTTLPTTMIVRGEVYAWSGTQATGASLFESAPVTTAGGGTLSFSTGGLTLTAGAQYVLFLTALKDAGTGSGGWVFQSSNPYAGGNFVYTGATPANWTTTAWNNIGPTADAAFKASFDIPPVASTTSVASSGNPSVVGQSVTFTATVSGAGLTPAGTVTFKDGATTLGTGTLNGSGQASFATAGLAVGAHSITAVYGGGSGYLTSTSPVLTQTVNKASTTTALASSTNPTVTGGSTTFTATVSITAPGAGAATGTATFRDGATVLGTGALNGAGIATFSTAALSVGSHSIFVDYGGDASFATSTSPSVVQVVNQDGASVALTSSLNPSTFGASTTFTATVTSVGTGGIPTGNVVFKDGSTTLGTVAVDGAGVATFATAALTGGSHSITASYGGDAKHTAAVGSVSQIVNVGASANALVSLTNPSVFGQSVTFRSTVTGTGATPTGTVTFFDGATSLGAGALNGAGQATLAIASLAVGAHSITASYGGDSNFGVSSSAIVSQQVNKAATATTLISSSQPSVVGAPVTFTATVAATAPGAGIPLGTVTFRDGATVLGTGALGSAGVATFTTSALAVGDHTMAADYGGNASFTASTSANVAQTVNKDGVTATLVSSLNPSTFGASVTFTATIASAGAGGVPTGAVTFKDGAAVIGTGNLGATGVATFATSALAGGSHTISASYGGDTNHAPGSSASVAQVVNGALTTTALTSSVNPSVFGQSTTLTATVTSLAAGTRTGTVTFVDGVTTLGTGNVDAAGVATLSTSTFTVGTHALSAVYGGDANYATSTSPGLSQVVNKGDSLTVLASSSNPSLIGSSVTFTATVTASAPSVGTPSGTVTFRDGATVLGTGALSGGGVATFATTSLALGAHSITASYGGSASHSTSTSAPLTQNVDAAAATITVTTAPSPSTYGDTVTVTATVTGSNGTPTGSIAFNDGATPLGNGTLDASGVATLAVATLTAGTHTLSAAYGGDATYATGAGTVAHVVDKAATATTLGSSLNPALSDTNVTFTATVTSPAAGFGGQVEFFDGTTSLGLATLASGKATLDTATLGVGDRSISATYKGDANFVASTSMALTETIGAKPAGADAGVPRQADAGAPVDTAAPGDTGGCGCRVPAAATSMSGPTGALFALAGALLLAARRRRGR